MTTTKTKSTTDSLAPYLTAFESLRNRGPDWLNAIRRAGMSHFTELGFPTTRHEDWIYTSIAPIAKLAFKPALAPTSVAPVAARLDTFTFAGLTGPRLVFVNGHFAPELSTVPTRDDGVRITNLAAAISSDAHLVESHLAHYARTDESGFSALNTAFFQDGAFIHVPAGKVVAEPVHLLFITAPGETNTAHPRNLIVAGANAQLKVIESYYSANNTPHLTNALTEISVGPGALVEHCKFQEENLESFHVATVQAQLARDSRFVTHSISTGARLARHNINLVMTGPGVDCLMNGLYLVGGKQLVDHHTVADHAQPHCASHEFYHGILGGHSRGVFNGKIFVRKDAQKTDAKQTSRNLLLTDTAQIDTKPQLEILADDVKCTHGATIGQLNDEAVFYCRSRGISEVNARRLLTHAFASEIINRITIEPVRDHLEQVLWERLEELIEKK
jgi:Fe-S cluster assembly protein SufD